MIHALFEFSPFLAGLLVGRLAYFRTTNHCMRPWLMVCVSLLIGSVCLLFAGELMHGLVTAAFCIFWDSGIAGAGAVAAYIVSRRVSAELESRQ